MPSEECPDSGDVPVNGNDSGAGVVRKDLDVNASSTMLGVEVGPSPPPGDENGAASPASQKKETCSSTLQVARSVVAAEDTDSARPQLPLEGQASRTFTSGRITDGVTRDEATTNAVAEPESLVLLEEAVDDGTIVKTAGTLFFTSLQVKRTVLALGFMRSRGSPLVADR